MEILRFDVARSDLELVFFLFDCVYSFVLYKKKSQLIAHIAILVQSIPVNIYIHMCTFL